MDTPNPPEGFVDDVPSDAPTNAVCGGSAQSVMSSATYEETDDVPEPARLGTCIGLYELVRQHGQGGMGVVYEAVQKNIGKRVAVKFLSARLSRRASARERFLQEARAGAKVAHPGLVQIFDHGSLPDGTPYILMEFLDGLSLRTHLSEHPRGGISIIAALHWTRQVASALSAAHAGGIVHRDLKPENLMLVPDPESWGGKRLKVLDFGIAKFLHAPGSKSRSPRLPLGTPSYMSPEQCRGDESLDGRSDVYSLGVVLYELLCGRPPFQKDFREPARVLYQQVFADPPRPRMHRSEIPEDVEALLLRMLSKAKEKRPTMAELEASLVALLPRPGLQPPGPLLALSWRMPIVILILISLAVVYLYQRIEPGMVLIRGAEFQMGSTQQQALAAAHWASVVVGCDKCPEDLYLRETPQHSVKVASFYLDAHEVTNQDFAEWVWLQRDATQSIGVGATDRHRCKQADPDCERAATQRIIMLHIGSTHIADIESTSNAPYRTRGLEWKEGRLKIVPGMENKPVVNVTWDGALQYCQSLKKRLPTEAEWELAARGPRSRQFPWGDQEPTCGQLTLGWTRDCRETLGPVDVATTSRDRTPEGVSDLGGNVAEWVVDYFRLRYPPCQGECTVTKDSTNPDEAARRVVRGGSWSNEPDASRGAARSRWLQSGTSSDIGFRCARDRSVARL